jgi:hypothetical protein
VNLLQQLESRVREEFPDVHATLDLSVAPEASSWLDLTLLDHRATVEWRPGRGFGVSSSPETVYGESSDELYPDISTTLKRVVAILKKRSRTDPDKAPLLKQQAARAPENKELHVERRAPRRLRSPTAQFRKSQAKVRIADKGERAPITDFPEWVDTGGGPDKWKKWVKGKVANCDSRAKKWAKQPGNRDERLPTRMEWREAINKALVSSGGYGYYSKLPLSLCNVKCTDWNYPSVDHVNGPGVARVVLETRLINDMKTIMDEEEFFSMVGHLAAVHEIKIGKMPDWKCRRSFAAKQKSDEPALPGVSTNSTSPNAAKAC